MAKKIAWVGFPEAEKNTLRRMTPKGVKCFTPNNTKELRKLKGWDAIVTTEHISPEDIKDITRDSFYMIVSDYDDVGLFARAKRCGLNEFVEMPKSFLLVAEKIKVGLEGKGNGVLLLSKKELEIYEYIKYYGRVKRKVLAGDLWGDPEKPISGWITKINKKINQDGITIIKYGKAEVGIGEI